MAVSPAPDPEPDAVDVPDATRRRAAFRIDPRRSLFYRVCRNLLVGILALWFRPRVSGAGQRAARGARRSWPRCTAPTSTSASRPSSPDRKLFFMAKDELWRNSRCFGRLLELWGVFPVHRDGGRPRVRAAAPRRCCAAASSWSCSPRAAPLRGRRSTSCWRARPSCRPDRRGHRAGRHRRLRAVDAQGIQVPQAHRDHASSVGEPVAARARSAGGRVARSRVHRLTDALRAGLQAAYDERGRR